LTWAFIYLMFILKIPIIGMGWIVWKAIKAEPAPAEDDAPAEGGGGFQHPRPRAPRPPRRGPHGEPLPLPPARVRAIASDRPPVR